MCYRTSMHPMPSRSASKASWVETNVTTFSGFGGNYPATIELDRQQQLFLRPVPLVEPGQRHAASRGKLAGLVRGTERRSGSLHRHQQSQCHDLCPGHEAGQSRPSRANPRTWTAAVVFRPASCRGVLHELEHQGRDFELTCAGRTAYDALVEPRSPTKRATSNRATSASSSYGSTTSRHRSTPPTPFHSTSA